MNLTDVHLWLSITARGLKVVGGKHKDTCSFAPISLTVSNMKKVTRKMIYYRSDVTIMIDVRDIKRGICGRYSGVLDYG